MKIEYDRTISATGEAMRKAIGMIGMEDGVKFKIEYVVGFEKCCYETWGGMWVVSGSVGFVGKDYPESPVVTGASCDLGKAFAQFIEKRKAAKQPTPTKDGEGL